MNKSDILWHEVYNLVPRVLGLMDRDPNSYTFGCLDRYYWHYKLHDFANARLQDGGWLLSLIYQANFEGNLFCKKRKVAEWALASIEWWMKIQHRNGSFDEAYPFEYSFCGSAFSTWWIAETFLELKKIDAIEGNGHKVIREDIESAVIEKLEKAGKWLMYNNNIKVGNQHAAAIAALGAIFSLTGKKEYLHNADEKLNRLMDFQDETGFFPEYGGCDVGYHSLTLTCLYSYKNHLREHNRALDDSLLKGIYFLDKVISEDGSYDWRKTSRRTQYLYPYSLMASRTNIGKQVFERFLDGIKDGLIPKASWIDDRYFTGFAIDYLRTYMLINEVQE